MDEKKFKKWQEKHSRNIIRAENKYAKNSMLFKMGKGPRYVNFRGKLQAFAYRFFHINLITFAEYFLAILALLVLALNFAEKEKVNGLLITAFAISAASLIIAQVLKWILFRKNAKLTIELENDIREDLRNLPLPEKYIENGYQALSYNDMDGRIIKYIMSDKVNLHLNQHEMHIELIKSKFGAPEEVKHVLPFAFKKLLSGEEKVFNGRMLRMISDLYPDTTAVKVQKTDYYTNIATNEIALKKIANMSSMNSVFNGGRLIEYELPDKTKELTKLENSWCANIIGINTLAVTNDKYLIINRQGCKSFVSKNMLVPSGSGSADYRKVKKHESFGTMLKSEMERELFEELNLCRENKVFTQLIGYARLVEKGGKPDFFGVSFIDAPFLAEHDKKCIKSRLLSSRERLEGLMGEPVAVQLESLELKEIIKALDYYCVELRTGAVQLDITRNALKGFEKQGREPFCELASGTDAAY